MWYVWYYIPVYVVIPVYFGPNTVSGGSWLLGGLVQCVLEHCSSDSDCAHRLRHAIISYNFSSKCCNGYHTLVVIDVVLLLLLLLLCVDSSMDSGSTYAHIAPTDMTIRCLIFSDHKSLRHHVQRHIFVVQVKLSLFPCSTTCHFAYHKATLIFRLELQ